MDLTEELAFMHGLVDEASAVAMYYFRTGAQVSEKADRSPVTEADLAVEQLIRTRITEQYPDDALIGEEYGTTPIDVTQHDPRTWIVDPIDGTAYFAAADPNWRIHLVLQVRDTIELAVVAAPALARRWWAHRGHGAFVSDWPAHGAPTTLQVSTTSDLSMSLVACAPHGARNRVPSVCDIAPQSPLPLVELVNGSIDAFVAEGYEVWDHAPWILIVEEAGGHFTDRQGSNSAGNGGGIYSNAPLHADLVAALGYLRQASR